MTAFYVYKGARPSEGAMNLKRALGATMMRSEGSTYRGRRGSVVINWGTRNDEARRIEGLAPRFLNKVDNVVNCADKLRFFNILKEGAPELCIPYCTSYQEALLLVMQGSRMYARTVLNGHSGEGIVLMCNQAEGDIRAIQRVRQNNLLPVYIYDARDPRNADEAVRRCTLFTQGITGQRTEFRCHVVDGKVILTQIKLRREGHADNPQSNTIVRNVASGWVYGVNTVETAQGREAAEAAAIKAVSVLGLDFGAVDIVYKHEGQKVYVLEINTAPGLADEGSALEKYTEAFKEMFA